MYARLIRIAKIKPKSPLGVRQMTPKILTFEANKW
jgi:hypothetical protein